MSKISYPQLVKNLADAYRSVIGSTDPIVIGELTAKVTEAMNNSGVSVEYKSITYNEDNTITLIDKDDVTHTISCDYEDSKLNSIKYDNRVINLTYDGDILTNINDKEINLEYAPSFNVGESVVYKSITYNADDTVTLVDDQDVEHTMTCNYEDDKITSVILNEEEIALNYDGDKLILVEDTMVDLGSILGGGSTGDGEEEKPTGFYYEYDFSTFNLSSYSSDLYLYLYAELLSNNVLYLRGPTSVVYYSSFSAFTSIPVSNFETLKTYVVEFTISDFNFSNSFYHENYFEFFLPDGESVSIPINGNGVYKTSFTLNSRSRDFEPSCLCIGQTYFFCLSDLKVYEVVEDGSTGSTGSSGESSSTDNTNVTKTKDFQNGFIVGLASKGKVIQKTMSVESSVAQIIPPVNAEPITVEINNSNIEVETSVALESEE